VKIVLHKYEEIHNYEELRIAIPAIPYPPFSQKYPIVITPRGVLENRGVRYGRYGSQFPTTRLFFLSPG